MTQPIFRTLSIVSAVVGALTALAPLNAHAEHRDSYKGGYSVPSYIPPSYSETCARFDVVSDGSNSTIYQSKGQSWIEGRQDQEYQVNVQNQCPFPVLAVVSVDGLNVVDGTRARASGRGYIVAPYSNASISGWRRSLNNTAAFYFTFPSDSYGSRVGRDENLGVIGAAFYKPRDWERDQRRRWEEQRRLEERYMDRHMGQNDSNVYSGPAPAPGMGGQAAESMKSAPSVRQSAPSLGTGYGRIQEDAVTTANFERERNPFNTQSVRYETRRSLIEKGVIPRRWQPDYTPYTPNPFPADRGFVPPPANWR